MDGYRYRQSHTKAYTGLGRSLGRLGSRLMRRLRETAVTLTSGKVVEIFRYALGAASFIFMLGVASAMETGLISLTAGMFICIGIGICYLILGHNHDDGDEE